MSQARLPLDVEILKSRAQDGPCFVCATVARKPDYLHEMIYEDDDHVGFLDRWPTVAGKVLVAPKAHIEHVVRDLDDDQYHRLMAVVRLVALAVEDVLNPERTYVLSLGSQQGNSHLHWHVAGLPPGTPYDEQQFHALMAEHGVLEQSRADEQRIGKLIRDAIRRRTAA
ncbi:HIT family protein [Streptomyces sp. NPDC059783]|uniref:HIT family protein n=1 Tax=Streptomyces sp. NPDC059783 TaxID=3346944 RepID=UPI00365179BC